MTLPNLADPLAMMKVQYSLEKDIFLKWSPRLQNHKSFRMSSETNNTGTGSTLLLHEIIPKNYTR